MSTSYQRVMLSDFGGPEVLTVVEEQGLPEPKAGELRIKVLAATASFTDTFIRWGKYMDPTVPKKPNFTPGYDIVGEVDILGSGVTGFQKGQKVAALTVIGGYTQYICLQAEELVPVPESLESGEAVSLVLTYTTAYQLYHRAAEVQPGAKVLIHGGGGAVGQALLELGQQLGLTMAATAKPEHHDNIRRFGAEPIDYTKEDFVDWVKNNWNDADVVFDFLDIQHFKRSLSVLRKGGKLVAYGFHNFARGQRKGVVLDFIRFSLWNILPNGRSSSFYSITAAKKKHPEQFREDLTKLFGMLERREIQPTISTRLPLEQVVKAHQLLEDGGVKGRIILQPFA